MGLFNFVKDLEHKISGEEHLEAKLTDEIKQAKLAIAQFAVKVEAGVATISGQAASQKDLELARLIVGNHRAIDKVNDDGLTVTATATQVAPTPSQATSAPGIAVTPPAADAANAAAARMVTVKKGDTLSKIAEEYLGKASLYPQIFEANKPMLKNPDAIFPGQVLRIPSPAAMAAH